MISFIEGHRDAYGVEPTGKIPPAEAETNFYAAKAKPLWLRDQNQIASGVIGEVNSFAPTDRSG